MSDSDPVAFNRKSAELIGREIKKMRGQGRGELPLPKRRRGHGGGGGGGDAALRFGRVTVAIPASTSNLADDWGLTGKVRFMDDETGVLDVEETEVINKWMGGINYGVDFQVCCDCSQTPPVVQEGLCMTTSEWAEEE